MEGSEVAKKLILKGIEKFEKEHKWTLWLTVWYLLPNRNIFRFIFHK